MFTEITEFFLRLSILKFLLHHILRYFYYFHVVFEYVCFMDSCYLYSSSDGDVQKNEQGK